jgi:hypothetical protein
MSPLQRIFNSFNEWFHNYKDDGLVVIGFYHHKSRSSLKTNEVKKMAEYLGYKFPVAIDYNWATLKKWWLDKVPDADFTSISFLIDPEGSCDTYNPGDST